MCACKQKKSFLIKDILSDGVKKPYKNLSIEPKAPLICSSEDVTVTPNAVEADVIGDVEKIFSSEEAYTKVHDLNKRDWLVSDIAQGSADKKYDYDFVEKNTRRHSSVDFGNTDIMFSETRHLANEYWSLWANNRRVSCDEANFWAQKYLPRSPPMLMVESCDKSSLRRRHYPNNSTRFAAPVARALEHRFAVNKYLTPQQRQTLAAALRISERQVKTWFQNRRAKWRRGDSCQQRQPETQGQRPGLPSSAFDGPTLASTGLTRN